MGFLAKMKSLKNAITGGGAKVSLSSTAGSPAEPFEVSIQVEVGDADLNIGRVYLEIEGREIVEIPDTEVTYESGDDSNRVTETVSAEAKTASREIEVSGEQTLAANQSYEWTTTVELPADSPPPYRGKYCKHGYVARASLACFGNDPDSGWVELAFK